MANGFQCIKLKKYLKRVSIEHNKKTESTLSNVRMLPNFLMLMAMMKSTNLNFVARHTALFTHWVPQTKGDPSAFLCVELI